MQANEVAGRAPAKTRSTPTRLTELEQAHIRLAKSHTPTVEDYVEVIYELVRDRGYAKAVDVSGHLHVRPSTVTKMLQKLDQEGLLKYHRYGGLVLTGAGEKLARSVRHRHEVLSSFLQLLGVDEATAHRDTEGLEHHVHPGTIERITRFVEFVHERPAWFQEFRKPSA